ncbi:DUF1697 domain-containing protein [Kocuria sp.]|uniref:DUF1697 domain-containing protein n=1 Tax=Kocuria sp. TaxID=1871328 RepID=UPI0026E0059E|nr:DUF1697 domain-containing protein [Kocuria sp.]MDO5619425.1 DUF1697 domain-containing protein [Kocuria sp.]
MRDSQPTDHRVVALLRGINVGGRHKVPMAALRDLAQSAGLVDVQTYIQSGNLMASDPLHRPLDDLGELLSVALQDEFGFVVPVVMVRTDRLTQVLAACPWPDVEDPRCVHGVFYPQIAPPEMRERAAALMTPHDVDQIDFDGEVLWLHTPSGLSASRVAERVMQLSLPDGRRGTARNLRSLREIKARI